MRNKSARRQVVTVMPRSAARLRPAAGLACTLGAELDLDGVARLDRGRLLGGELDGMAVVVVSQDRIGRPQPHSPYALSGGGGKLRVLDQAFRRGAPALQLVELGLGVADLAREILGVLGPKLDDGDFCPVDLLLRPQQAGLAAQLLALE